MFYETTVCLTFGMCEGIMLIDKTRGLVCWTLKCSKWKVIYRTIHKELNTLNILSQEY
jgi:hypothetical protein